ncbi:MAG: geranylgeranylglyceryl/heptaprenylglyceryl phosphate synthase [Candidatus Micrarchaeota archaeon]|nr:geranylgeranylglyceryl/heptaprenylglyceryl phosphate synthase [Candidatus Micrarchaeota archaeon]
MKVEKYILDAIKRDGGLLFVVIDPCDYPSAEHAAKSGILAAEGGADVVLVGGSTGVQGNILNETITRIKEKSDVPVVLFPGNVATINAKADAVYFMSMLNSRNPYWISQAQALAAPVVKCMGLEPLPVGYIVVEPGGTVGWVGDANVVPRERPKIAAALALAGQYMGCRFILTDVGSASKMGPVPVPIVKAVSGAISIPYIVAGGINSAKQAAEIISAGADAVQVGTMLERSGNVKRTVSELSKAVKLAGRKQR